MAWRDERIAVQIVIDSARVIAAGTAVALEGEPADERDDLVAAIVEAAGNAADDPNAYAPAALALARFCGRECDPLEQAAAFASAFVSAPVRALEAQPVTDYQVVTLTDATLLFGYSLAIVRRDYAARPEAERVRADYLAAADAIMNAASEALVEDVYNWIFNFVGQTSAWVAETITNRMPLVGVATDQSTPSTVLAYRLYGDPDRAGDLVGINGLLTALFMPIRIEAIADFSQSVRLTGQA